MIVYFNGSYLPKEQVHLSPDDRGFLFGDGVYEVVRTFGGFLFRAEEHWQRLRRSLEVIQLESPDSADIQSIAETLLEKNGLLTGEATVYLQITRGAAPRKHTYPHPPVPATVYASAAPFTPPREKGETGVRVLVLPDQRWTRCDIKAISLLPNVMASQQAHAAGAHEAILVRDGAVTEGSHSNFAAVRGGAFITHPESNHILSGITRKAVLQLCRELDIPVRESPILESELRTVDEAMLLGTATDVMPVVRVNNSQIGDGRPGPVTRRLQAAFRTLVAREKAAAVQSR